MKKILFMKYPQITSYPTQANMLAGMPDNEHLIWYFEHSLNMYSLKQNVESSSYVGYFAPIPWKSNPWLKASELSYEIFNRNGMDIIEFVINNIDLGYYTFLYLNRYYLKDAPGYQFRYNHHDILIYGYDTENKEIYYADIHRKYDFFVASFEEIRNAYATLDLELLSRGTGYAQNITIFKPQKPDWYRFDVKKTIVQLEDYLYGKTSYEGYCSGIYIYYERYKDEGNFIFGLNVYDYLESYGKLNTENKYFDFRGYHALHDHMKLILLLVTYLSKNRYCSCKYVEMYEGLSEDTLSLRNKIIKCRLSQKEIDVTSWLQKLKSKEKEALENLLDELRNQK